MSAWRMDRPGRHLHTSGLIVQRQHDDDRGIEWAIWNADPQQGGVCLGLRRTIHAAKERAASLAAQSIPVRRPAQPGGLER